MEEERRTEKRGATLIVLFDWPLPSRVDHKHVREFDEMKIQHINERHRKYGTLENRV